MNIVNLNLYTTMQRRKKGSIIQNLGHQTYKVHIFWEDHTILRNHHRTFDHYYIGQIYGGDFAKSCGLLRIRIWTLLATSEKIVDLNLNDLKKCLFSTADLLSPISF